MVKNYLGCLPKGRSICLWVVHYQSRYPSPIMTIIWSCEWEGKGHEEWDLQLVTSLSSACLGRCGLVTILANVEMLHNNILRAIEEMQSRVDIEDEKHWHNAFEKAFGLQIPMLLDDITMVVHTRSNPLIFNHRKSSMQLGPYQTPLNDLQSQNLAKGIWCWWLIGLCHFP
jgi:hypothetical protein